MSDALSPIVVTEFTADVNGRNGMLSAKCSTARHRHPSIDQANIGIYNF